MSQNTTAMTRGGVQAPSAAPGPVSDTQHSQFLSDVLTAAGLITHGKRCKALGERLSDMVMRLRAASPTPPAEQQATRCSYCDGTGDVHGIDGEWRGFCTECEAGTALRQQAAPKAAPVLPEGWTACTIEFGNDGPEEVAYGPQRMMTRLAKWLGKYFAQVIADAAPKAAPGEPYKEELARLVATVDAGSSADYRALQEHRVMRTARAVLSAAPKQEPAPLSDDVVRDAARYRWLRNKSTVLHGTAWLGSATAYQRDVDFLRRDDALAALDAVIDAALAAQGGKV